MSRYNVVQYLLVQKGRRRLTKGRICKACKREIQRDILDANLSVCPFCGYYMRFHAKKRIVSLADKNSFREWDVNTKWSNPLNDDMYARKLVTTADKHKLGKR